MAIPFHCPILRHLPLYEDCHYCPNFSYLEQRCELAEPTRRPFVPRPIVNVTYKVNDIDTPAFKDLQEQITLITGRLTKYFEGKKKAVIKTGYKGLAT